MLALDRWLLERVFERFSRWTQRDIGLDCFALARVSLVIFFAISLMEKAAENNWNILLVPWLTLASIIFVVVCMLFYVNWVEERVAKEHARGLSNSAKQKDSPFRSMLLVINVCLCGNDYLMMATHSNHTVIKMLFASTLLWYSFAWYFAACDPLPPCKSNLRQFVDNARAHFDTRGIQPAEA